MPDDLTPAERRDWQALAERRDRRERAGRSDAAARRAGRPAEPVPRRAAASPPRRGPLAERRGGEATVAAASARVAVPTAPAPRTPRVDGRAAVASARPRQRRRPRPAGASPDRLALWAVVMCILMALVAAATARGSEPDPGERGAHSMAPLAAERGSDSTTAPTRR